MLEFMIHGLYRLCTIPHCLRLCHLINDKPRYVHLLYIVNDRIAEAATGGIL